MKKFLFSILIFLISVSALHAETLTLVTYYPAPEGAFKELFLSPSTVALDPLCEIGTICFDSDGRLRICEERGGGVGVWKDGIIWASNNDYIFLEQTDGSLPDIFVGLGTSTPEFKFSMVNEGSFMAKGTYGSGVSLTTTGLGARFILYPRKAALRSGYVSGTKWNNSGIGNDSIALGLDTFAPGVSSIAMVDDASAESNYSIALGFHALASAHGAIAIGLRSVAGGLKSVALGSSAESMAINSTAIGGSSEARNTSATAIGFDARANGVGATAMGHETRATGNTSFTMGFQTTAERDSTAMGYTTNAEEASTAMGYRTEAPGTVSTSMGNQTSAMGNYSFAAGSRTIISGINSVGIGKDINSSAPYSSAIGESLIMVSMGSNTFGQYNRNIGSNFWGWVETDPLFVIGNGVDNLDRRNAITVLKNGNVGIGKDNPESILNVQGLLEYADNAAAMAAGLTEGAVYRTGDVLKIVH